MIDDDDGGELPDVMELESEIEPAVEFVSQSVWRQQSVQFQFQTQELAVSAVKPSKLSKERFVCTPRPLFRQRNRRKSAAHVEKARWTHRAPDPAGAPKNVNEEQEARGLPVGWRYIHRLHVDPHEALPPQSHAEE